jgi:hypothetical protein
LIDGGSLVDLEPVLARMYTRVQRNPTRPCLLGPFLEINTALEQPELLAVPDPEVMARYRAATRVRAGVDFTAASFTRSLRFTNQARVKHSQLQTSLLALTDSVISRDCRATFRAFPTSFKLASPGPSQRAGSLSDELQSASKRFSPTLLAGISSLKCVKPSNPMFSLS